VWKEGNYLLYIYSLADTVFQSDLQMRKIDAVKLTMGQQYASDMTLPNFKSMCTLNIYIYFYKDNRYRIEDKVLVLMDQVLPKSTS